MDITIKKCDCCGKEARSDREEDKEAYDGFARLKLIFDENPKYSRKLMTANVCESCIYDLGLAQKKEEVKEPDTCGLLKGLKKIFRG